MSKLLRPLKVLLRDLGYKSSIARHELPVIGYKVYIAQELGLPLCYAFSYFNGLSSKQLRKDIETVVYESFYDIEGINMQPPYNEIVSKLKELDKVRTNLDLKISDVDWWKVLALIFYHRRQETFTEADACKLLCEKPYYLNETAIITAFQIVTHSEICQKIRV